MFRSIFKKLRGKSVDKENNESEAGADADADAEAASAGEAPTVGGAPGVGAARKSIVSAPKPIPSTIDDPIEGGDDADDPDGAINPIAAASAAAADTEFDPANEAGVGIEVDLAADPVVEVEPETGAEAEADPEPVIDEVIVSAEELCGIDPETMDREEIRARLAVLYRRYNAVASSLNADLRAEAEQMLDAIVACREAYVDHL